MGEQGRGSPLCPQPVLHKGKRPREAVAGQHGDTKAGKDPQGNRLNTRNVNVKAGPMLRLPPAPCPAAQDLPQDQERAQGTADCGVTLQPKGDVTALRCVLAS